ncbi:MAG: hemolysin family protein [Levilactobacillus sp.]|uniref:HlyC/CorC family transporter n=1 Tax=Levilactobacillus suantsaiihabitans TaxID=2487722 RepID=A0A4Z0JCH4_9LACO|nr:MULTISPECIES: hemolysin family protein [Levilactobacillus]MCI1552868.1 hemolysin family protein [Levilactobacillus sp.]MCI1598008.1 hemolysin family protein [Levilactobacillus sp.]MCI1605936.1 hemolysin family protein [Levilactobacillus sp.]TGD20066.1 HlyC/CorC family transporter [Levilactobacillus suantsaiihabitans]
MDSGQIVVNLIIILITFFFAAFFVACEFALVQTRPSALEEKIAERDKPSTKLNRAMKMVTNLNEYLSTTQVGVSLAGIILGWIGETFFVDLLLGGIAPAHLNGATAHTIAVIVGVLLLTYLEVVFTEIVPKNISIDMPMKVLMLVVTPLHYCHVLFYPFVWLLNSSASGVVKLMGLKVANESDEVFSQAEILNLSRSAVEGGELEKNDLVYMQRAFELNDKVAKDIMIDRTQLVVIDITANVKEALNVYLQERFSRLPVVADGDKDKILGYVYNYDLIRQQQVDSHIRIDKLIRDISTTPETTPITQVLQQMIKKRTPIVVVVDEYGGTSGIITDKDIYEELFGTVRDEIDDANDQYIFKQPNGTYQVNGKMTTYDFERYFNTDIKGFEASDTVTMAGFIIDNYPDVKVNDVIQLKNFDLKVLDYENSFINWLEVTVNPPQKQIATADAEDHDKKDK